jgi:hypothetical protein
MQSRQENTVQPSRLDSFYRRLMAVDDEADITFTPKKELEQSGLSLDVSKDPIVVLSNFKLLRPNSSRCSYATDEWLGIIIGDKQKRQERESMFCHCIRIVF